MKSKRIWKVAGINFDHMHMGDLLRLVHEHPAAEIAGVCHREPAAMEGVVSRFGLPPDRVFTNYRRCLEATRPDVVILCPATAEHGAWVERVAPYGAHVLVEKPFAASLAEADRMIAAMRRARRQLVVNWPLRWYPCHVTAHRLVREGVIGRLQEVHYYDGNRGPLRHTAGKIETKPGVKSRSWWYQRKTGGGSLLDYLGYGVTLGTWFHHGKKPVEVTAIVDEPRGLEVDEHSITVCRYAAGLSKYETRWGTFTDPWTHQPQPKCGFVLKGSAGTIASYDYEGAIRVQTEARPEGEDLPVDKLEAPYNNPISYFLHCLETGEKVAGPLSPSICRIGQQIVDSAVLSARTKRTVRLIE
jgi:glucose-fructose oxidoreductase